MKHKTIIVSILSFLICLLLQNPVSAISSSGGYSIEAYDINMIVNENNTFDITETISVNFTGSDKHGIYRKIPLKNKVERLDGTTSTNKAEISNISVSDNYTTSNENGYKVIKIGSSSQTVKGNKTYTIKYTYDIGEDPLKDADELYFNLIGDEWDVVISNVTFTITMPKEFDKSTLGFSLGNKYSTDSSNVTYTVSGNTIKGSLTNTLSSGQALTVRLTLPDGYFVGARSNFDYIILIKIAISILFVVIAFFIWRKYGKDEVVVDAVEFYPPEGLNSAEVGFLYRGHCRNKDIISLLIYLANKGYLKIEEYEETTLKVFKSKEFRIIKLKEYDGDNKDEETFFYGLFKGGRSEVTKSDLRVSFYSTIDSIACNIGSKENKKKIFDNSILKKKGIIIAMLIVEFIFSCEFSNKAWIIPLIFSPIPIAIFISLYKNPSVITAISGGIFLPIIGLISRFVEEEILDKEILIQYLIYSLFIIILIIFIMLMKKRTPYGKEMLEKIQGFKNFLKTAEKPRLEQLVMENPEYFYNILPYTYVLGVSNKWMKKFEDIAIEPPQWYDGYTDFNTYVFMSFMNSTYSSISNEMASRPSSSGGSSRRWRRLLGRRIFRWRLWPAEAEAHGN